MIYLYMAVFWLGFLWVCRRRDMTLAEFKRRNHIGAQPMEQYSCRIADALMEMERDSIMIRRPNGTEVAFAAADSPSVRKLWAIAREMKDSTS